MIYALILIAIHFLAVYICSSLGRTWLMALFGATWVAVNMTVQMLIIYPIGISSTGAITYSLLYPILMLVYVRYGMKSAMEALRLGMFTFIFVSLSAYVATLLYPVPQFNQGVASLYSELWGVNAVPYLASLSATYLAAKIFLGLIKYLKEWPRAAQFYLAFIIAGAINSLIFFPGSLGIKILDEGALVRALDATVVNVQLKAFMGLLYIPLVYLGVKHTFSKGKVKKLV